MALGCSVPALHTGAVPQTRGATARREETVSMRRGEPEGVERTRWEREVLSEWEDVRVGRARTYSRDDVVADLGLDDRVHG